jgi:hypothetical protein
MLNTLANHGYLPHDGKDISEEQTITVLGNVLNIDKEFATALFQNGVSANPEKNATTFSLSDLTRHNVVEHDASMRSVELPPYGPQSFLAKRLPLMQDHSDLSSQPPGLLFWQ